MPKRTRAVANAMIPPDLRVRASQAGTHRYADRWRQAFTTDFFRATQSGLAVSSIALGTYLGESDDATDYRYAEVARAALRAGINVIDTSINYRCQRSERLIGRVLQDLIGEGAIQRDEVVLCTKAGYVPLDGSPPASREQYEQYVRSEYLDSGVVKATDLVGGGHSLAPTFIADQLNRSMQNLGVQSVDYFYLHNPEQQLAAISNEELSIRLRAAFEQLESFVSLGTIGAYGVATWHGLRLPAGSKGHLSLYELAAIAKDVAGNQHHFRIVQLPINLTMSEAVRVSTQRDPRGRLVHVIDAATDIGIDLVASAPLLQGQLTQGLPEQVRDLFVGSTDAQRALAFVRTLPAVVTAAVGMKSIQHLDENLAPLHVG
jgi:aryl-alcohol dehydrogenase-like predicted oxidoreductase